jgi:hypothetical protein
MMNSLCAMVVLVVMAGLADLVVKRQLVVACLLALLDQQEILAQLESVVYEFQRLTCNRINL